MKWIGGMFATLLALFVDDGRLALEALCVLACTALAAKVEAVPPWLAMAILVVGTLMLLLRNVLNAARGR